MNFFSQSTILMVLIALETKGPIGFYNALINLQLAKGLDSGIMTDQA